MLQYIINYTTMEERDGTLFLLDESKKGILCHRVDELENIYREIRELLLQNDYPVSPDWIHSIAQKGADGLQEVIIKDTENEAKRLKVPFRIAEQWKRTSIQEVPREVWGKCDSIRSKIISLSDGLPRLSYGYTDTEGVIIDKESAEKEIESACSYAVTDEIKADANTILTIAKTVRALELKGINARELIGKYALRNDAPSGLELYRDMATRRHAQGFFTPTDLAPFIATH